VQFATGVHTQTRRKKREKERNEKIINKNKNKRDEFVREGWGTCEQAESQFRHLVPNNSYYPKWLDVRVSHAEQHRENNNKVIPETPIAEKYNK
jgi:hypothetical protein